MPSHYIYDCENGHEELRYRNSSRCRQCGGKLTRRGYPVPDLTVTAKVALAEAVPRLSRLFPAYLCVRPDGSAFVYHPGMDRVLGDGPTPLAALESAGLGEE